MTKLKKIHQPYGSLSALEIKQARSHAKIYGPGIIPGADPHRFPPFYGNRSGFS